MLTTMVFAKGLESMASFYREAFGLTIDESASEPGFIVLHGDRSRLALHEIPDHVASTIEITEPPAPRSGSPIKLIFSVADAAEQRARLVRLGSEIFETTVDDTFETTDPEGNLLRVMPAG